MQARRAGPQLTYLIPHVHADRAGLTRPLQTLPVRTVKKASKAALPGDTAALRTAPWPAPWGPAHPGRPMAGH